MPPSRYPRDLIGYGRHPPDPRWPNGARVALQFVINYEEGGENNILHGDAASEAFLSDVLGAAPWPGQRHMNVESMYEYGARAGFRPRLRTHAGVCHWPRQCARHDSVSADGEECEALMCS